MPDQEDPQPPRQVEETQAPSQPTELTDDEYHVHADRYMDAVNEKAEAVQEERADVDVEFSVHHTHLYFPLNLYAS